MNVLRFYRPRIAIVGLLALSLAACSQSNNGSQPPETPSPTQPVTSDAPTLTPTPGMITGKANVDKVEVRILESFPVQVMVTATGNLPDGCTTIDRVDQQRNGNTFMVTITTVRPTDKMCVTMIVPYEKSFALDVAGLKAGTYTVNVNGVTETFELKSDNKLP